jgi:hypothetical protein
MLGGIIGHQSGELAAGLAIGAALEFGDDIVRGISQMGAKDEDLQRDFKTKAAFDMEKGKITLPICPFNQTRVTEITNRLRRQFETNGWACEPTQKTVHQPWFSPDRWKEKWTCATDDGKPFEFQIDFRSNRDTELYIRNVGSCDKKAPPCGQTEPKSTLSAEIALNQEDIAVITRKIYHWIEAIVLGG